MSILAALTAEKLIHWVFCWKRFLLKWEALYAKKKNLWEQFLCANEFAETFMSWTKEHPQRAVLNSTPDALKVFLVLLILARQGLLRLRWGSYHIIFSSNSQEGHKSFVHVTLIPTHTHTHTLVLVLGSVGIETLLEFQENICYKTW